MRWRTTFLMMLLLLSPVTGEGRPDEVPPGCVVAGTVLMSSGKIGGDPRTVKALEEIIARIQAADKDVMVRVEGHAGSGKTKSDYITRSLNLAKEVERFLRVEKDLKHDLYLAAMDDKIPPRRSQYVRVVLYPNSFKERSGVIQMIGQ